MLMPKCIKQHLAQFMKKLSNTEAELKKSVAYKKKLVGREMPTYNIELFSQYLTPESC